MSRARQLLIAVLVMAVLPWQAFSETPVQRQPTFRSLLDRAGWDYVATPVEGYEPIFRVYVEIEGEIIMVAGRETTIGEERLVSLWASVAEVPDGFRHPPAMLRVIADMNGLMIVGNVGLHETDSSVIYSSKFWLRGADIEVLGYELMMAHYQSKMLRGELRPFIDEGT
mgnify:CR=1 FL=1